jgi:hypothetical protein
MKGKTQSKDMDRNSIRKSKLFHREEMQHLGSKDILKVVVIAGIIVVPLLVGLVI